MSPKKRQHKANHGNNKKSKAAQLSDSEVDSDIDELNGDNQVVTLEDLDDGDTAAASDLPKWNGIKGRLLICGGTNWDLIGRKELPKNAKNSSNASKGMERLY